VTERNDDDSIERAADTPSAVRELAQACVAFVRKSVGIDLDFTTDTLPLLDHYLSQAREGKGEIHTLVAAAAGAYFGEVIRRQYPARWALGDESDHDSWRLEFEQVFLYLYPVVLARSVLEPDASSDAGFSVREQDRPTLASALELLGEVDEDVFYLLSTRFDVLSSVAERLTAIRQKELGIEELPVIEPAVYERSIAADPTAN
jgi:hypothetical protein